MPTKLDTVLATEIGYAIGILPMKFSFAWLYGNWLHVVLSRDAIEVFLDECNLIWVCNVLGIHRDAYSEVIFVSVFVPGRIIYLLPRSSKFGKTWHCSQH